MNRADRPRRATRTAPLAALLLAALVFFGPTPARAVTTQPFNVGVSGAYHLTSGDLDLLGDRSRPRTLSDTGYIGLHVGYLVLEHLMGFELNVGVLPHSVEPDGTSAIALPTTLDVIFYPIQGVAEPYLAVGGGILALLSGDAGTDVDFVGDIAFGARIRPIDQLGIRIEARLYLADAVEGPIAPNVLLAVGVDFLAGGPDAPVGGAGAPPPDDEDDLDGDGIDNVDDACPRLPGPEATRGCPDTDGDGLLDPSDQCPASPGPTAFNGCPDTDGDGIADLDDACPTEAGAAAMRGCPDADGDGVEDSKDACPEEQGSPETDGCPDPAAEELRSLDGPLEGVAFKRRSAKLTGSSRPALAKIADILQRNPDVHIRLTVHVGRGRSAAAALRLSQSRANAVAAHLIKLGVAVERIKPVGGGRSKSRRDEVLIKRLPNVELLEP